MTITITKNGKGRGTVTVDGRAYTATFDTTSRRWTVMTDGGPRTTTSPKLKSCAALFGPQVTVTGASAIPRTPRAPRQPKAPRPRRGQAFATPKPDARGLKLVALAALEDVFVVALREKGITPEARTAYERYSKLKALALGPTVNAASQNEADSALRMSAINLVKLTF